MPKTYGFKLGIEGEQQYKQKLTDINKSMKVLSSDLKRVKSEFEGQDKSVHSLTATNDALKRSIEGQKEKIRMLSEALENASASFGENDNRTKEWRIKLNEATTALNKMERELNDNEQELAELEKAEREAAQQADHLGDEVEQTGNQAKQSGRKLLDMKEDAKDLQKGMDKVAGGIKKAALAIATAAIGAATALAKTTVDAAAYADEILETADVTGMSTERIQAYTYAAELLDTDLSTLTKTMAKNVKGMSEAAGGSKKYKAAYEKLGVQVTDTDGKLRNSEDVYWELIDALGQIKNDTERDALSMQLFGKSAQELNPLIKAGSKAVKNYTEEAKRMGAVLDNDTLESLGEFDDSVQRLKQGFDATKRQLGTVLLPELQKGAKWGIEKLQQLAKELKNPKSEASELITGLKDLATTAGKILFNAVKIAANVLSFLGKNIKIVIPVVGTLVTGFLVLRAACAVSTAITAVQTALAALPATATAAKVAMTGLSAAMSTNVVGIVLTAVAAVAGLAIAFKSLADSEYENSPQALYLKELKEKTDDLNNSYKELNKTRAENVSAAESETAYLKKLADELDTLTDESGKVKDADKARAKFILGTLNEALGTEYEMTGNQVKNYQDMKQAIYDLIEAKKAQILLDANEDAYRNAIEGKNEALATYTETLGALDEAERKLAASEKALADLQAAEKNQSIAQALVGGIDPSGSKKTTLTNSIREQKKTVEELRKEVKETGETVAGYYDDITTYESASAALLSGNTDEAIRILETRNGAFIYATEIMDKTTEEQKRILKEQYENAAANCELMEKRYREGTSRVTKEMVEDAKTLAEKAGDEYEAVGGVIPERMARGVISSRSEFTDAARDTVRAGIVAGNNEANAKDIGTNLVSGMTEGVRKGSNSFRDAMRDVVRAGIIAAKAEAQIKSPSRKMRREVGYQIGKGAELGIKDSTAGIKAAVVNQMRTVNDTYRRNGLTPISEMFSGVYSGFRSLSGSSGDTRATGASSVINVYPHDLTPAQIDYLVRTVNSRLGFAV